MINLTYEMAYKSQGKSYRTKSPDNRHFKLNIDDKDGILTVTLVPKAKVEFSLFSVIIPYTYGNDDKIFVNGFQSWTDSMEYSPGDRMNELSRLTEIMITNPPLVKIGLNRSGDTAFWKYPRKNGIFYGWSYGYVRRQNAVDLFGSLNERCGYTAVTFNTANNTVRINKDLEGVTYDKETLLLSLAHISGDYDDAFDEYFNKMGVKCRESKKRTGYTTWYNYYGNITREIVNRDLNSIKQLGIPFDCFQIDDGYQNAIGDWLITDAQKFPEGMKAVADDIHRSNMIAGLWMAPFAGVKKSKLFQEHSDWFIRGKDGKPYITGANWGGFYSLDIYNPGVRDYLRHVFDVVLNDWGYDLVKLDFLYGAAVLPMYNKTRGEIMCDAVDLLRECCGDKLILGCGVPLMPAFGKVDYCRIGADIDLKWADKKNTHREDVSTPHAVCNTVFRRHLDGRAWKNDPDVFLLRDSNIHMDFPQRRLLSVINSVFGSLLFISDNVSEYSEEQKKALAQAFADNEYKILSAEFTGKDILAVVYTENGIKKRLCFNIRNGEDYTVV